MGVDLASPLGWRAVGASVAGTSHAGSGEPCADACAVGVLGTTGGDSLLVAVAADGAGTSERAPEGARLACEAILEQAELWALRATERAEPDGPAVAGESSAGRNLPQRDLSTFTRADVLLWVEATRRRIADAADSAGLEISDFSCTLLVALVDETAAVFFQIGDGAIVYRANGGGYVPAFWPQSGEYANCTWFVTDEEFADRVESAVAEGIHEVALLTDGLQALALRFESREAHGPFFEPMFKRLRSETKVASPGLLGELRSFLDSPPVNERTGDDKTLILATRLFATPTGETGTEA
jgi:hypothetical protein